MAARLALLALVALAALPASQAHAACSDFSTQAAAQAAGSSGSRDADGDGVYCESLPCPCARPGSGGGGGGGGSSSGGRRPARKPAATIVRARITRVVDGDTLRVRLRGGRNETVRVLLIDTPETKRPGRRVEQGGRQATAAMKRLAFSRGRGRAVFLTSDPNQDRRDRFGRRLAYVDTAATKRDLGRSMVAKGWAKVYEFGSKPYRRIKGYRRATRQARGAKRGVWGLNGGNFHRPLRAARLRNTLDSSQTLLSRSASAEGYEPADFPYRLYNVKQFNRVARTRFSARCRRSIDSLRAEGGTLSIRPSDRGRSGFLRSITAADDSRVRYEWGIRRGWTACAIIGEYTTFGRVFIVRLTKARQRRGTFEGLRLKRVGFNSLEIVSVRQRT